MTRKGLRRDRKGTFSVEAAIILISFVVIASALAFVVMNMGFFAAQKTKDTMAKGIQEASSALELDGSITAYVKANASGVPKVKYLIIPVKTCVARSSVDLSANAFIVSVVLKDKTFTNLYNGTYSPAPDKLDANTLDNIFEGAVQEAGETVPPLYSGAMAIILTGDKDEVLELNEKAYIIIRLAEWSSGNDDNPIGPASYETIKIEFRSGEGATLSLERQIPPGLPDSGFVDLG